jgi:hypothetical protein
MIAKAVTQIFIRMSVDEARAAVVNATDAQLMIRQALNEFKPESVMAAFGNHHAPALPSPNGKQKRKPQKKMKTVECKICHEQIGAVGIKRHEAKCSREHQAADVI